MAFTPSTIIQAKKYTVSGADGSSSSSFSSDRDTYYMLDSTIRLRESRNTEFKAAQGNYISNMLSEVLAKYACAFANGEGGTLYLGILDNGIVKGIPWNSTQSEKNLCRIVKSTLDQFLPSPPVHSIRIVPVYNVHSDRYRQSGFVKDMVNRRVIRIEIQPGALPDIWENGQHRVWLKRDGSVEMLGNLAIKDLAISKYKESLELRGAKRAKLSR